MAATLTVPTIFTAVDRFSKVISNMMRNVGKFSSTAGDHFQRFNQRFNNFFKLGDIQKQLLSYASTAVSVGAIVSGIVFSGKSLMDYEKNVASVHGILNDLSANGFKPFQQQIDKVAQQMQFSAVDVASSFQKIAELNISLAKTPESIGAVSKAAITLSRASNMDLTPATESLVGIMAQFKLEGKDANRVINVLAAGLKYGSASIIDQTEAYRNWGTVAKSANLTIEQATALTQTLGKYQLKGSEAGTALRGTIIRLQKAHLGYASGVFNVNDALAQANRHYDKLGNARLKDAYLIKLFGIRQITAGRILLQNTDLINDLTKKVTGSNQAFTQAAINTDTVAGSFERLKAQFINYITGSDKTRAGMVHLKEAIRWVADNMDTLLDHLITGIKWFAIIKGGISVVSGALKLYNLTQAASIAIGATATTTMAAQSVVVTGFGGAIAGVTTELGLANTAASGFFATLSEFVVPAGLVALSGLAIWKLLNHPKWMDGYTTDGPGPNIDPSTKKINWFSNQKEEDAYQKWWLPKHNKGIADSLIQRENFAPVWDKTHPSIFDLSALKNFRKDDRPVLPALTSPNSGGINTKQDSTVHIVLHDPNDSVKQIKTSAGNSSTPIPVKITSTQGQSGNLRP